MYDAIVVGLGQSLHDGAGLIVRIGQDFGDGDEASRLEARPDFCKGGDLIRDFSKDCDKEGAIEV